MYIRFSTHFVRRSKEPAAKQQPSTESLAEEDIPHASKTMQKDYDVLMKIIEVFFRKIKNRDLFLQLRAFINRHFTQE
jgi:hypothetical protein